MTPIAHRSQRRNWQRTSTLGQQSENWLSPVGKTCFWQAARQVLILEIFSAVSPGFILKYQRFHGKN
jgi:hypothetical protein